MPLAALITAFVLSFQGFAHAEIPSGCELLFSESAQEKELRYLASNPLERATAFTDYMNILNEASTKSSSSKSILISAPVRTALTKTDATAFLANRLSEEELDILIRSPLARKQMEWAYQIRNHRLYWSERLNAYARNKTSIQKSTSTLLSCPNTLLRAIMPAPSVWNANQTNDWLSHGIFALKDLISAGGRMLSPIPLPASCGSSTGKIFSKLEKTPSYEPDSKEFEILKNFRAVNTFLERKKFLLAHPRLKKYFVRPIDQLKNAAKWGAFLEAASLGYELFFQKDKTYSTDEFLKRPISDNQVQLLNETAPFPHLAIRIGGSVYSYGQTTMTRSPVEAYLKGEGIATKEKSPFRWLSDRRAVQVVTLNLDSKEVARLEHSLMLSEFKTYRNKTLINDCSSMVSRALKENTSLHIPQVVDPSPSMVMMYLNSLRLAKSKRVERYEMVVTGNRSVKTFALQAFYMNYKDALINQNGFLLLQGNRFIFDRMHKKEQIQFHTKNTKAEFLASHDDVQAELAEDTFLSVCSRRAASHNPDDLKNCLKVAPDYFNGQYKKIHESMVAPGLVIDDAVRNYYKAALLSEYEKTITGKTSFDFMRDLNDPKFQSDFQSFVSSLNP